MEPFKKLLSYPGLDYQVGDYALLIEWKETLLEMVPCGLLGVLDLCVELLPGLGVGLCSFVKSAKTASTSLAPWRVVWKVLIILKKFATTNYKKSKWPLMDCKLLEKRRICTREHSAVIQTHIIIGMATTLIREKQDKG